MNVMRKLLYLVLLNTGIVMSCQVVNAQPRSVSGTVVAQEDSDPLQGVTVTNRNTNQKTQTNNVGYFSITADKGQVLQFTYVGYTRRVEAMSSNNISALSAVFCKRFVMPSKLS